MKYVLFGSVVLMSLLGCKKTPPVDMEFEYFPIQKGRFVVYRVHEVTTNLAINQRDTSDYFIKAIIGDTLSDNEGRIVNQYRRYYGETANGPWTIHDVWTTVIASTKAELVEENDRVIKLVFKPTDTKEWNANAYNTKGELNCFYTNIGASFSKNGLNFSSTVQVEQANDLNFIEYKRKYEVYAKGVGMVYKLFKDFKITGSNPNNVQQGKELIMEAVSFGIE